MNQKEPYFGSVRFFKNLILLFVVILIAIPTVCAIRFKSQLKAQRQIAADYAEAAAAYAASAAEYAQYKERYEAAAAQLMVVDAPENVVPDLTADGAEVIGYQSLYPDFYTDTPLPEATIQSGVMYLTFDDGPSDMTMDILSILEEKDVKATFFVVSQGGETSVERMKAIAAQGHAIGMHSSSHDYARVYESVESFLEDYYKLFTLLRDEVGVTPTIFRFPGGSLNGYNEGIYQEIIAEMLRRGFVYYDWNLSAGDAYSITLPAATIRSNILGSSAGKNRGIVLMHDANHCSTTVDALADIIDGLREQGFTFDVLDRTVKPIIFAYVYPS